MSLPNEITLWLIRFSAPPITLFTLVYGLGSPWWRSRIGQAVFTSSLSLSLLLNLALVGVWLGPYPGHEWVGVGVFTLVCTGAWLKLFAILTDKVQRYRSAARNGFGDKNEVVSDATID